jgi:membrane protein YdbS with pleckstrin-like domain
MQQQLRRETQPQTSILIVHPDGRKLWPLYSMLCILIALGFKVMYSSMGLSATWMVVAGFICGGGILFMVMFLHTERIKLRSTIYTVTQEYVAVDAIAGASGIRSHRIPTDQIESVVPNTKADPIQWLLKLGSLTVQANDGDSIALDFIPNPAHTMALIRRVAEQAKNKGSDTTT